jgi:type 1 glutamine amidotransferase
MKKMAFFLVLVFAAGLMLSASSPVRILVITGGHDYNKEQFNLMLSGLGPGFTYRVAELPGAFRMFLPEYRNDYDVLVFYHMWQTIDEEQKIAFADCIRQGKPLVALHHSICAFDDWPEYWNIIGGKYFHKPTTLNGKEYAPCSYIHDIHLTLKIADKSHPVTKGLNDFQVFDETYKGYYVADDVKPLLTTDEPSSTPVTGWAKTYGKAKVVVIQSGHDVPTFENPDFRRLLRQAIEWVSH